jgi:pimeloyl-ACP methyl ester carboxylesterase
LDPAPFEGASGELMKSIYKSSEGERQVRERYTRILERWPVANKQLRISTREGETFVLVSGPEAGPPLILLHGASANSASWIADVAIWASRYRVYAVDVIGDAGLSAPSRPSLKSDAHALWLTDVISGLGLERVSFVGVSNGGWLALDYAVRFPERVVSLVVFCPGGIVPARNLLLKLFPYLLLGSWGARIIRRKIIGSVPEDASPAQKYFADFIALIFEQLRPRTERNPVFSDQQLRRLTMPLLMILGGKDIVFDAPAMKLRGERLLPHAEIHFLPDAGHFIPGQTQAVFDFVGGVKPPICSPNRPVSAVDG